MLFVEPLGNTIELKALAEITRLFAKQAGAIAASLCDV